MDIRRNQLAEAARSRLDAATSLLQQRPSRAQVSAYLIHVGLECGLKARILMMGRAATLARLQQLNPELAGRLFTGAGGHKLEALAREAALDRLLAADGKRIDERIWGAVCGEDRPYSLRYGVEAVTDGQVAKELALAREVLSVVGKNL